MEGGGDLWGFFVSIDSVITNSAVFSRCVTFSLQQTSCTLDVLTPGCATISIINEFDDFHKTFYTPVSISKTW